MNKQMELQRIKVLLSRWIAEIGLDSNLDFFDINKISEGFSAKLLNLVFNLELVDLNKIHRNYPSIDLGDFKNRIAFQITSRTDFQKFKENLETFVVKNKNGKSFADEFSKGIRFLVLSIKPIQYGKTQLNSIYNSFDKDKHIISFLDLYTLITNIYENDKPLFGKIKDLLNSEFKDDNTVIVYNLLDNSLMKNKLESLWSDLLASQFFLRNDLINILNGTSAINFDEPGWEKIKLNRIKLLEYQIHITNDIFEKSKNFYDKLVTEFFNVTFKNTVNNLTNELNKSSLSETEKGNLRSEKFKSMFMDFWNRIDTEIDEIGKLINETMIK